MDKEWQRVSPLAVVYFLFVGLRQTLGLWPALLALLAGGPQFRQTFLTYGLAPLVIIFVASVLLHFWFFRFRVEADRIQVHRGVLSRKRLTLYFERVQQADIAQPFYFRPFGLATLGLESAGSGQQEVDIPGLPLSDAVELKDAILRFRRIASAGVETEEEREPDYHLELSWQEVARYGLMHNGLLLLAPVLAPLIRYLEPALEQWLASVDQSAFQQVLSSQQVLTLMIVLTALIIFAGVLLLFALSVAIALIRFWGYRLTRFDDQYQYRAGLGTVRTRGFRLHKLQQVTIVQGMMARVVKRYSLLISKAGAGPGAESRGETRFLVPVLGREQLETLGRQLSLPAARWRRVSPLYILWLGALLGSACSLLIVFLSGLGFLWLGALIYPLGWLVAWRYWCCLGIYQDDQWLAVRTGFVGSRTRCLPIGKIHKTMVNEAPWLKLCGLANLSLWGAEGRLTMPFLTLAEAKDIRDQTLLRVVTFRGPWF